LVKTVYGHEQRGGEGLFKNVLMSMVAGPTLNGTGLAKKGSTKGEDAKGLNGLDRTWEGYRQDQRGGEKKVRADKYESTKEHSFRRRSLPKRRESLKTPKKKSKRVRTGDREAGAIPLVKKVNNKDSSRAKRKGNHGKSQGNGGNLPPIQYAWRLQGLSTGKKEPKEKKRQERGQ